MVALTMMALALSEDSIRLRARRNEVINALGMLPEHIREVCATFAAALLCSPLNHLYLLHQYSVQQEVRCVSSKLAIEDLCHFCRC